MPTRLNTRRAYQTHAQQLTPPKDCDYLDPCSTHTPKDGICFFTDAEEASELLERAKAAHPEAADKLQLAVTPLGHAFVKCKGFASSDGDGGADDEYLGGELRLRGPRAVVDSNAEALRSQQTAQGLVPGAWVLPCYCHDDFQTEQMMPFFFSPSDFAAGWVRSGRPEDAVPENLAVMDLRVLVKQMEHTDAFDWSLFQFVSSEGAYALASELLAARRAAEGGGEQ